MPTANPPARTALVDTYPNPSVAVAKGGIGALWDWLTGLLGTDGSKMQLPDGSVGAPVVTFASNTGSGLYKKSTDVLGVSKALDVVGSVTSGGNFNAQASGSTKARMYASGADGYLDNSGSAGALHIRTTDAGKLHLGTNGLDQLTLDAGNLGLGVSPTAFASPSIQFPSSMVVGPQAGTSALTTNLHYSASWKYIGNGYGTTYQQVDGAHYFGFADNNTGGAGAAATPAYRVTFDAAGRVNHTANTNNNTGDTCFGFGGTAEYSIRGYGVSGGSYGNAANAAVKVNKDGTTSRSINSPGTINASGADYAEYEERGVTCPAVAKGAIIGFDATGKLTAKYAGAIRFGIKSTAPSYVGGDTWGDETALGEARPERPEYLPPVLPEAPVLPEQPAVKDPDKLTAAERTALEQWHDDCTSLTEAYADECERLTAKAQQAYRLKIVDYEADLAIFEQKLEAARAWVDRVAYSGKVPVAVYNATPGDYIVAVEGANGTIAGQAVAEDAITFAQYRKAVGRVNRILDAAASAKLAKAAGVADQSYFVGMAEVAVIVH